MKRVAYFLALLLIGGLVLWLIDRRAPSPEPPTPETSTTGETPSPLTPPPQQHGELTPIETGEGKVAQFAHSGPFEVFVKDLDQPSQPLKSHVKARDSRTLGDGSIDLVGVEFERYDVSVAREPERDVVTPKLELEGRAERMRAVISRLGELDTSAPIPVRDARVTYHSGSRFAPLHIEAPSMDVQVDAQRATSDEMVSIVGVGVSASGRGLELDGARQLFVLRSEPKARFQLDGGEEAVLIGRGELVARSRPDLVDTLGPEAAVVEVREGGVLSISGEQPLEVDAQSLILLGRIDRANSTFVAVQLDATGQVRVVSKAQGEFHSDRLVLTFDERGRPSRAAFDGSPTLDLVLRERSLERVPTDLLVEGDGLTVHGDGAGPLEVFFDEPQRFEFNGPARLQLPGLGAVLECDTLLGGELAENGSLRQLSVDGAARATYDAWRVTSERFDVESFLDGRGRSAVRLTSPGETRIVGKLEKGEDVELVAAGGLVVDRLRDSIWVRRASQAVIDVRGASPFHARADEVQELDLAHMAFLAEGDIELSTPQGTGRGDRLEAWAVDRAELAGTPEEPARFDFRDGDRTTGRFEALFIEAQGKLIHARGGAAARVAMDGLVYDLHGESVVLELRDATEQPEFAPDVALQASGGVNAHIERNGEIVDLFGENFRAEANAVRDARGRETFEPTFAVASDGVRFEYQGKMRLAGSGETLELHADRRGRLTPAAGEKVRLNGTLPNSEATVDLIASQVDFSPERLSAISAEAQIDGLNVALGGRNPAPDARSLRVIAGSLECDAETVLLGESVWIGGKTADLEDWDLDTDAALLKLDSNRDPGLTTLDRFHDLVAWGGFRLRMGGMGGARGSFLELSNTRRSLVIAGDPTSEDEDGKAVLERGETVWMSDRFSLDLDTGYLRSEGAEVRPLAQDDTDSWTLSYEALEPIDAGDETIQAFRSPVWRSGDVEVRAAWAMVWVDAARWRTMGSSTHRGDVRDPDAPVMSSGKRMFDRIDVDSVRDWLHEVYLDGDVEYRVAGENQLRAEGIYMDMVDGHGWITDAVLDIELPIGGRKYGLKLQADWLRYSIDGSMQTKNAVATTCDFAVPHYVIKIGSFSRTPRMIEVERKDPNTGKTRLVEKLDGWDLSLDDNALDFLGLMALPLPRIAGRANPDNKLDDESLSIGNLALPSFGQDSKLGTFISASITTELGPLVQGFHWILNRLFSGSISLPSPEGSTRTHADLNSRGLVVGTESTFQSRGRYRWTVIFDAIYDRKDDRGLVRVDSTDRSEGRAWLRSRGRYLLEPDEWLDFVISRQSDPGVQAEFFENNYLRFEERETFVHWRRAKDERYASATLETRLEDFRTEVIDQPEVNIFRGRSEIGRLGELSLVQSSYLSIAHLARLEGDPRYEAPFADGFGDRDVLRADGDTRYETPWNTGFAGVRVTPFVEGRVTAWSENAAEDSRAGRAALFGGVQASTTFWKRFDGGSRHVWTPAIGYRGDIAYADDGGQVAYFDPIDAPIEGRVLDLSVRSRWEQRELKSDLDFELVQSHADAVAPGEPEGWLPTRVRSTWLSRAAGMPFGVSHDAQYDLADGDTRYSRTIFGFEPTPGLDIESGYHSARDNAGVKLYDAATVGARYQFSTKWEIEGNQTFSNRDSGQRLASSLTLRRIGHDFVFEIENAFVAGEGRSSLRFKFTPLFAWRDSSPSRLDRWRAARQ